jgi:hypothetical protein
MRSLAPKQMSKISLAAALMLAPMTAYAGPIEEHPPVLHFDNPLSSMLGAWKVQGDDRTFTVKMEQNLTIKVTAVDEECTYSNFIVPDAPTNSEVRATMHCLEESSETSGRSTFNFFRTGHTLIMVEAALIEKKNDLESNMNGDTALKQVSPPDLFVRLFFKDRK